MRSYDDDGSAWVIFGKQVLWTLVGLIGGYVCLRMSVRFMRRIAFSGFAITIVMLVLVLVPGIGKEANGSRGWFVVAGFSMQPSELAKMAFAIWGAHLLAARRMERASLREMLIPLVPAAVVALALIVAQPDLGQTVSMGIILLGLLWYAGLPLRVFLSSLAAVVVSAAILAVSAGYRSDRVRSWLNPENDPQDSGYQARQAKFALAQGGIFGDGLGQGVAKWNYLPNAHNDFIFAIIGEELGLVGALGLLGLFGLFAYTGMRIASRSADPAGSTAPLATTTADGNLDRDGGVAMSGGLFGLLDHVAVLARLAAASIDDIGAAAGRATAKAAGVVIDDTAVTPQYVHRITAERELPIIKRIAIGSVRNKLLLILPGALLLSQLVPWLLTPLLMLGATYLCYEGAEKVCGVIGGRGHDAAPQVAERELVAGAIRTDFILSAEIMVIALNEVADQPFVPRLIVLVIVALVITAAVYGVVAVIVQMDDVGLRLTQTASRFGQRIGGGLVAGMPKLLSALSAVGMGAMLWVGGHIVLVGSDHLGWHAPYRLVHHLDDHLVGSAGGALTWLVSTAACAATGLVIGIVVVALVHLVCFRPPRSRSL